MPEYARVLDGAIIETRVLDEAVPLAPNKGVWMAVTDAVQAAPEGQVLASTSVELQDGAPVRVGAYAAAPRRLIAKSVVQERVNGLGKLGDAFAALNSQPLQFGRWFAPDWPQVYADDEGLLAMLTAIGLTADQIATVTAP